MRSIVACLIVLLASADEEYFSLVQRRARWINERSNASDRAREDDEASPEIPHRLLFTYKYNILEPPPDRIPLSSNEPMAILSANVRNTLAKTPGAQSIFLGDKECQAVIQEAGVQSDILSKSFAEEADGSFKSDICRGAGLYLHGGWYMDNDLVVLQDITKYIPVGTTFVTSHGDTSPKNNTFQAIIGTTPRHPIIKAYLEAMAAHYQGVAPLAVLGTSAMSKAIEQNPDHPVYWLQERNLARIHNMSLNRWVNNTDPVEQGIINKIINNLTDPVEQGIIDAGFSRRGYFLGGGCEYAVYDPHNTDPHTTMLFWSRAVGVSAFCYDQITSKYIHSVGEDLKSELNAD